MRTIRSATALLTVASVVAVWSTAWAAGPTQADFDACNREAQSVSHPSASPSGASAGSATSSPSAVPDAAPSASSSTSRSVAASGSSVTSDSGADSSLKGLAAAGKSDPAYQQAYRDCLKRRGF